MNPAKLVAFATNEFRTGLRNRWVVTAVVIMTVFSCVLAFAGSAPSGATKVEPLTVLNVSLVSLSVYMVPLLGLLLAYDAFAGERERGTLSLLLTYPIHRYEIVLGKFLGHSLILACAIGTGFGVAAVLVAWDGASGAALVAYGRLAASALLLGMAFLALGYVLSALSRQTTTAAALSVGLWLVAVVLFDLVLLSALVADKGGTFTTQVFPWLLVGNPADGFRLFALSGLPAGSLADELAPPPGVSAPSATAALVGLFVWTSAGLALSVNRLRRMEI